MVITPIKFLEIAHNTGGRQYKTVPIPVYPKQTWMFPLHDIAIKVAKCTKYEITAYDCFKFLVSFP